MRDWQGYKGITGRSMTLMREGNVSHGTIRRDRGTHVQIQILHKRYGRV